MLFVWVGDWSEDDLNGVSIVLYVLLYICTLVWKAKTLIHNEWYRCAMHFILILFMLYYYIGMPIVHIHTHKYLAFST